MASSSHIPRRRSASRDRYTPSEDRLSNAFDRIEEGAFPVLTKLMFKHQHHESTNKSSITQSQH